MKKKIILAVVALLLIALVVIIKGWFVGYSVLSMPEPAFCPPSPRNLVFDENRKLIKTGKLEFTCRNLDETRTLVEQALERFNAFISKENLTMHEDRASQYLVIKVPAEQFDALIEALANGAETVSERSIRIEDVTEQYVDTEARLTVKRELEARYRELLNSAETVKDILAIEEQIASLREDIESAERQLQNMDNRVTYSTLEVTYYEAENTSIPFPAYLRKGLTNGWNNLVWALVGIVNIWPFVLITAVILIVLRIRRRRNRDS